MNKLIFLSVLFVSCSTFALGGDPHWYSAPSKLKPASSFSAMTQKIELEFANNSKTEFLLMEKLPRIRYFQIPSTWLKDWHSLEVACAILTEKHRKEHAIYRAKDGKYWLVRGSSDSLLPPEEVNLATEPGKFLVDNIFHTHPTFGIAGTSPSEGDNYTAQTFEIDKKASIISMDGFKSHYDLNASAPPSIKLFIADRYPITGIESMMLNVFSQMNDEYETFKAFKLANENLSSEVCGNLLLRTNEIYRWLKGKKQPRHSSLPAHSIELQVKAEIENWKCGT